MKTNLFLTAALSLSLCVASTAQTLPAYLPTDGLVGWWPFNGNANDESGNGNDGTVNGATLTEDRFGVANAAYDFDGVDDYIYCGSITSLNNSNKLSISAWFNYNQIITGSRIIGAELVQNANFGWGLSLDNFFTTGNSIKGIIRNSNQPEGTAQIGYSNNNLQPNTIFHAVMVFDGSQSFNSGKLKVYIDGIIQPLTYGDSIPPMLPETNFATIIGGINGSITNSAFDGSLDDIAIYNRALTPEEITALYTGEPVNPPTACNPLPSNLQNGLVGYWPFCGNANDESGNGNDGTVNGATLTEDRFGASSSSYYFDNSQITIGIPNNQFANDFSISTWVKLDNYSNLIPEAYYYPTFIEQENSALTMQIELHQNLQKFNCYFLINPGIGGQQAEDGHVQAVYESNNWAHVVLANFDGTNSLYVNGVLTDVSNSPSSLQGQESGSFLKFGSGDFLPTENFKGSLDDIGIWNRALTADEVQQLYTLNACTFTIYDTVTVTETIYDTVSVSVSTTDTLIINTLITSVEPAQENTFLVYPNPASTQITINNGNVAILGGYTMRITNSLGQDVYNQNITQAQVTLDLSTWGGNGLYVLYIVDPQQNIVAVKQIVLQ